MTMVFFFLALGFLAMILSIVFATEDNMLWSSIFLAVLCVFFVFVGIVGLYVETSVDYYRQGQIDALSKQKITVKLEEQEDGSRKWVDIKEEE